MNKNKPTFWLLTVALAATLAMGAGISFASDPQRSYYVYAAAESDDEVALIRHGPEGTEVVKRIPVGSFPAEIEGPHGLNVSPGGRYWYLSLAHGMPYGSVHKYETGSDEWVGDVTLGLFPATLDIAASTGLMYVVNFNLHGKMEPSTISIVEARTMIEVAQVPTGVMPHGARLNSKGDRLYSVNMMDDELIELDALKFEIARRLKLGPGMGSGHEAHAGHGGAAPGGPAVEPTWVTAPTPAGKVYVTGNKSNQIFEVDLETWEVSRRFDDTSSAPYNLAATPDGRLLVATYKKGASVGIWDLEAGKEVKRIRTLRSVPHGVVISPDGRFAFVTVEGKGAEPGTVEVIDLAAMQRVGSVDMGKQAGGIAFWKAEP